MHVLLIDDKMFSGRQMWLYLFGSFINALVMAAIPLCIFQSAQSIEGGMFYHLIHFYYMIMMIMIMIMIMINDN